MMSSLFKSATSQTPISLTTHAPAGYEIVSIPQPPEPAVTSEEVQMAMKACAEAKHAAKHGVLLAKQLAAMTAISAGSPSLGNSSSRRTKKKMKGMTNVSFDTIASRPQLRRVIGTQSITVEMTVQQTAFTTSAAATVFYGNYLTLASFSNYASYTSLFDQYKFEEFEVWMQPFQSQSTVQALTGTWSTCIDLDDANTPTTIAGVEDHQGCLVTGGDVGHYHRWKPHVAVAVYSGAFTSFANAPACWIDSASPGVQHYGIKSAITATTNAIPYTFIVKALVTFRSPGI